MLYPTPLLLRARIAKGLPLAGVDVESAIQSAAGPPQVIQLKDDGVPPDRAANDGEYVAQFSYSQGGIHQITTTFHVVSGVAMLTEAGPLPSIGPFGESFSPTLTAVRESYTTAVTSTVNVIGFAADDHGNVTSTATLLAWNNLNVAGRIDLSGDVDAFRSVSSLAGFRVVRVHTLGNGMQPRLRVFGKTDTSPLQEKVMVAGAEEYPFVWVWLPAGEPLFALVDDVRPGATGGTYSVSVGPPLESGSERVSFVFVPAILR